MTKTRRHSLLADSRVQGLLLVRVTFYWFYCLLSIVLMTTIWHLTRGGMLGSGALFDKLYNESLPIVIATLMTLPLVIMDCMRFSNRFAGPVVRVKNALLALNRGEKVERFSLRKGDHWVELAEELNQLVAKLEKADSLVEGGQQVKSSSEEAVAETAGSC